MNRFSNKYLLGLIALVVLAAGILFYKLDAQYMWTDEVFSFHAAQMIIEKGRPIYESGLNYDRAGVYHYLLAGSMKLFGQDEFGSRVVNIPFALGTMLLCYFFTVNVLDKNKKKHLWGLGVAILYVLSNFTIAAVRETRMYTMETFLLTASIFTFYKAFIKPNKKLAFKLLKFNLEYDPTYAFLFISSFAFAFDTQKISALIILGILTYFFVQALLKRNGHVLLIYLVILLLGLSGIYFIYNTFDLYSIYTSLAPGWATDPPVLLYYPVLLTRNLPGILFISPLILWGLYKEKDELNVYLLTIFLAYVLAITIQPAQSERYLIPILPTLIVLSGIGLQKFFGSVKFDGYVIKCLIIGVVGIVAIPHLYLSVKELTEIDTYTHTSIYIHKKFEFNNLVGDLEDRNIANAKIIVDAHSAYTLYSKGLKPDYILTDETNLEAKRDDYFDIKYMQYPNGLAEYIKNNPKQELFIVLRDYKNFDGVEELAVRNPLYDTPRLYELR